MAETSLQKRLRGLILSAPDLQQLTNWPDSLIEDYLNILDNLIDIAVSVDTATNLNIQTKATDYTTITDDGAILIDGSLNQVIISLDASAIEGQNHTIKSIDDTFPCYVGNNGKNIDAVAENFQLWKDEYITVRADSTGNWWIIG